MGSRGPVPKRSEDRHRRNKDYSTTKAPSGGSEVVAPPACDWWPDEVADLYNSLAKSGQSRFYEASDWAYAQFIMGEMSRYVDGARQNGQVLTALLSGLTALGVTEGDRRRMGIELGKPVEVDTPDSNVVTMDKWLKRFAAEA